MIIKPIEQQVSEALGYIRDLDAKTKAQIESGLDKVSGETKSALEKVTATLEAYAAEDQKVRAQLDIAEKKAIEMEAKLSTLEKIAARNLGDAKDAAETAEIKAAKSFFSALASVARNTALISKEQFASGVAEQYTAYRESLSPEYKTIATSPDFLGGYLVPQNFEREFIDTSLVEVSPMRQIATVKTGLKSNLTPLIGSTKSTVFWEDEGDETIESDVTFSQKEIITRRMSIFVSANREAMDLMVVSPERLLPELFQVKAAEAEGLAYISGNGVKRPKGLMTYAGTVQESVSGNGSAITLAGLTRVLDIKGGYSANARYIMNRQTWIATLILLQASTGSDTQAMFDLGNLAKGIPSSLNGFPVTEMPAMDNIGPGTYPVAFGDFRKAYTIYDRAGMELQMDPYSDMRSYKVNFYLRKFTGGDLMVPEAVRFLKIAS